MLLDANANQVLLSFSTSSWGFSVHRSVNRIVKAYLVFCYSQSKRFPTYWIAQWLYDSSVHLTENWHMADLLFYCLAYNEVRTFRCTLYSVTWNDHKLFRILNIFHYHGHNSRESYSWHLFNFIMSIYYKLLLLIWKFEKKTFFLALNVHQLQKS